MAASAVAAVIALATLAIPPNLAAVETVLSVAGAGVGAASSVAKLYLSQRDSRRRHPQRKTLDLSRVRAMYVFRGRDTLRAPRNLEVPEPVIVEGAEVRPMLRDPNERWTDRLGRFERRSGPLVRHEVITDGSPAKKKQKTTIRARISRAIHLRTRRAEERKRAKTMEAAELAAYSVEAQLRRLWQRPHVYNVLSRDHDLQHTFERYKTGVWMLYTYPDRTLVATIRFWRRIAVFGPNARGHTIEFHVGTASTELRRRKIRHTATAFDSYNVFYTADGAPYHWSTNTRKLERVVNDGGKDLEVRQTVCQAKPLRRHVPNYEFLIDSSVIDPIVVLCTGFISMKTQWKTTDCPVAQNVTELPSDARSVPTTGGTGGTSGGERG
ncbi:uncharacterized protein V1518DRAFT_422649 [Limtongia smithiae]|uniref:uncharacterized protein n=1 Tax=Limtongia smithiae TaxID=1125753 RepID=UPI0034CFBFA9